MDSWSGLKVRRSAETRGDSALGDRGAGNLDSGPGKPHSQEFASVRDVLKQEKRGFAAETGREKQPLAVSEGHDHFGQLVENWAIASRSPPRSSGVDPLSPIYRGLFLAAQSDKKAPLPATTTASILSELWQPKQPELATWPGRQSAGPTSLPPLYPESSKTAHLEQQAANLQASAVASVLSQRSSFDTKQPIVLTPNLSGFSHKGTATSLQSSGPSFHDFLQLDGTAGTGLSTAVSAQLQDQHAAKGWSPWSSQSQLAGDAQKPRELPKVYPPPLLIDSPLTSPTEPHTPSENMFTGERKYEAASWGTPPVKPSEEADGSERPPTDSWHGGLAGKPQDPDGTRTWISRSPTLLRGKSPPRAASDSGMKRMRDAMNLAEGEQKKARLAVHEGEPRPERGNQEGSASVQEEEAGENSLSRGGLHLPRATHVESPEGLRRQLANAHRQLSESQLLLASMEEERGQWQQREEESREKSDVTYSEDDLRALVDGVTVRMDRTEYALRTALEEIDQIRIWVGRPRGGLSVGDRAGSKDA